MNRDRLHILRAITLITLCAATYMSAQDEPIVLHAFAGGPDGAHPDAGLVFDPSGNLFGITAKGGNQNCGDYLNGCGTLFELVPNGSGGWTEQQVFIVPGGVAGGDPVAIAADTSGDLIIAEFNHGLHGAGQIVELLPNGQGGWIKSLVHAFSGPDGFYPVGITLDNAGHIYGMAQSSTKGDYGLVFKISKNASGQWFDQTLFAFDGSTGGGIPDNAAVALDSSGNLYGTLYDGGNSRACGFYPACGMVFQLSPSSDGSVKETTIYNFTNAPDGVMPSGNLLLDASGNIYGTTLLGGVYNAGAVFELSPQVGGQWQEAILYSFTGENGASANTLAWGPDGNLYGTSGTSIFELAPDRNGQWTETTLYLKNNEPYAPNSFFGPLVFDASANIYGTAMNGDLNMCRHPNDGCGLAFEIEP